MGNAHSSQPPPLLIQYIQDRDLWLWQLPQSKEFSAGLANVPFTFEAFDSLLEQEAIERCIERGSHVLAYQKKVWLAQ